MMTAKRFSELGPDDLMDRRVREEIAKTLSDRETMARARLKIDSATDDLDPMKFPAEPKEENLFAIIDTREQLKYDLSPMQWVRGTLGEGDYSLVGLEHIIRIERKNFGDFLMCVGNERERFEKEISRLKAYEWRHLVIEATWEQIHAGDWPEYETRNGELKKSEVTPAAAKASIWSWMAQGIPVHMAGSREAGQMFVRKALLTAARHQFENVRRAIQGRMVPYMIPKEEAGPPEEYV